MADYFTQAFDVLNRFLFGPVGAILSVFTFCLSLKIKQEVTQALNRKSIRENLSDYNKRIQDIESLIRLDKQYDNGVREVAKLTSELKPKFPKSEQKVFDQLEVWIHEALKYETLPSQELLVKLVMPLAELKTRMEMEANR